MSRAVWVASCSLLVVFVTKTEPARATPTESRHLERRNERRLHEQPTTNVDPDDTDDTDGTQTASDTDASKEGASDADASNDGASDTAPTDSDERWLGATLALSVGYGVAGSLSGPEGSAVAVLRVGDHIGLGIFASVWHLDASGTYDDGASFSYCATAVGRGVLLFERAVFGAHWQWSFEQRVGAGEIVTLHKEKVFDSLCGEEFVWVHLQTEVGYEFSDGWSVGVGPFVTVPFQLCDELASGRGYASGSYYSPVLEVTPAPYGATTSLRFDW